MAVALASADAARPLVALAAVPPPPLDLDAVASRWQCALDAAERALLAARRSLPAADVEQRRRRLAAERLDAARELMCLGRAVGSKTVPWLSPVPVAPRMLGLPEGVRACVFDLDGVLTDSAVLHAAAWAEVFDDFLLRLSDRTGRYFVPFDPVADYRAFIDGRPRLEGIHTFLESRGIHSPEGASWLARAKGEALARAMHRRHATAVAGTRRYLEAAGRAGLGRAVVCGSTTASAMLEQAGLATLVDACVDADTMRREGLRSRPAPDVLLAACRLLDVTPSDAVTFTHSPDGVAAGHAAGIAVVGVGDDAVAELLHGYGADPVVGSLRALLDRRLGSNL
jgi:HAD superfamily hydrolase (TIGR01509 family)